MARMLSLYQPYNTPVVGEGLILCFYVAKVEPGSIHTRKGHAQGP